MVSFTHVQNIICSQTQLGGIAHEHTIICRQLFADHVVGSRPMKKKEKLASNDNDNNNNIIIIIIIVITIIILILLKRLLVSYLLNN